MMHSHWPDLLDVAAVVAGGQIREGLMPRSSAGAEVGDEQRRPEVNEVDGGVGVDPLCTEVGEGRAGVDPAGKHGVGTETTPRVRVRRPKVDGWLLRACTTRRAGDASIFPRRPAARPTNAIQEAAPAPPERGGWLHVAQTEERCVGAHSAKGGVDPTRERVDPDPGGLRRPKTEVEKTT